MEQPGAWAVLRSTLPAACLPPLVYCWELCFEQLKKTQFTLILLVVLVVAGVVGSWLFLLGCFSITFIRLSPKIMSHQCHVDELSMSRTVAHL